MLKLNHNAALRTPKDIAIKVPASASGSPRLRHVSMIKAKVNGTLYIIWQKAKTILGYVFTQGRPISVSGRMIRLNGQR